VSLTVQATADEELLDTDYIRYCEANADYSITLEEVRKALASIPGSMTDDFIEEREDKFCADENSRSLHPSASQKKDQTRI
jgi:hypothetical protein